MIWVWAGIVNGFTAIVARSLGWVSTRGAVVGFMAGSVIYAGVSWPGWLILLGFFVLGSAATRSGLARKERMGIAQKRRGARGAKEALANTATGGLLAVLAVFVDHELLPYAFAGAFATALADTGASELGPLLGRRTFLPVTLRPVPAGTEGAISVEGTLIGALAAALLAGIGALTGFLPLDGLWIVPTAAVVASYVESVLGSLPRRRVPALLQQNELLNLLNTVVGATLAGGIALLTRTSA